MLKLLRMARLWVSRILIGIVLVCLSTWLTPRCGLACSIVLVSALAGALCAGVAVALRRVPMGRVTFVNRLAPIVLPFGFHIGRGKLWPVVVCSWAGWTIIATIAAVHSATRFQLLGSNTHDLAPWFAVVTVIALIVDGIGIAFLANNATKYLTLRSPGLKSIAVVILILLGLMLGSVLVWRMGYPRCGTALAALVPMAVGGFYSLFFLVMRNQRFN
jgi:hypothetical protein